MREKFDKECPNEDQERYNWCTSTGNAFKKKCDDMFCQANRKKEEKLKMKDLQTVVNKYDSDAGSAFSKADAIDQEEFYEMLKYYQWQKDVKDGVFKDKAKKAESPSSSSCSETEKKGPPRKGAAGKKKAKKDGKESSSDSGAAGVARDVAVGVGTAVVIDAAIDAAVDSGSDHTKKTMSDGD